MRVFPDTNVLVSAYVARGLCADLLRAILVEHELLVGEVVLAELRRVLRTKLRVPVTLVESLERDLRAHTVVSRPPAPADLPARDRDDGWIVASAVAGRADVLVSGDADLLAVAREAPVAILSPRAAWELLHRGSGQR